MFDHWLRECRSKLAETRGSFLGFFGIGGPESHLDLRDQIPPVARPHYVELLNSGTVVWSCIAQANDGLFTPGPDDLPANAVYSLDPWFDANPHHLADIAGGVFDLKDTKPRNPELAKIAAIMSDEYNDAENVPLPPRLTENRPVYLTWAIVHRSRLPGGVLSSGVVPTVVSPGRSPVIMHLPLSLWPPELVVQWSGFDGFLARLPPTFRPLDLRNDL